MPKIVATEGQLGRAARCGAQERSGGGGAKPMIGIGVCVAKRFQNKPKNSCLGRT